ncbi:hypothetical protein RIF29_40372 [Crotalaria pallida]|uniref:Uncharacterized protein n=1 Tax=Crotalaria pallida TaxID=3830 RepID=A0AAN9E3S1_CROPI
MKPVAMKHIHMKSIPTLQKEATKPTPPLANEIIYTGASGKNPGGTKSWTCKHCKNSFKSTYTRIHYHFFGAPTGRSCGIKRCPKMMKDKEAYAKLRKRVQEAEESGVSSSLNLKSPSIIKKENSKPIADSFHILERADVDMKRLSDCREALATTVVLNSWKEWLKRVDINTRNMGASVAEIIGNEMFWEDVENVIKITKPIYCVIKFADGGGSKMGEIHEKNGHNVGGNT